MADGRRFEKKTLNRHISAIDRNRLPRNLARWRLLPQRTLMCQPIHYTDYYLKKIIGFSFSLLQKPSVSEINIKISSASSKHKTQGVFYIMTSRWLCKCDSWLPWIEFADKTLIFFAQWFTYNKEKLEPVLILPNTSIKPVVAHFVQRHSAKTRRRRV